MLRVDAERLARNKRGEYLDLLARVDDPGALTPPLTERISTVLADARVSFPERYLNLSGPVPWAEAVMVRIAYRGPRKARLAELIDYLAHHQAWHGTHGDLVRVPLRSSGIDTPTVTGMSAGLRLRGRDPVLRAQYPPADTPPVLLDQLLHWARIDDAQKVYISTWNRDRRATPAQVRTDLPPALEATSNIGVVTHHQGVFRRLTLNRDCAHATVSCQDAADRLRELDRYTDLFRACRRAVTFAGVNYSHMVLLSWESFLSWGAKQPPHSDFWGEVASTTDSVVPDAYALQLHTPAQPELQLGAAWLQKTTGDGYRIIRAADPEPWLAHRWPDPHVLAAARVEFDSIIARPTNPLGYLGR